MFGASRQNIEKETGTKPYILNKNRKKVSGWAECDAMKNKLT
jgi:hypothetical protein